MPRFRTRRPDFVSPAGKAGLSAEEIRDTIAAAMRPGSFFAAPTLRLEWEHQEREEVAWELFQGRLLDPAHTRQRQAFETWQVFRLSPDGRPAQPLLSVKWDRRAGLVHVTRGLLCYVQEGYHAGGNVYLSRETQKWVRELVGTIALAPLRDAEDFRDELRCQLFQAVVGTSRLPLTSVEAPLPEFTLGELAYCDRPDAAASVPLTSVAALLKAAPTDELCWRERVKLLEILLRGTPADALGTAADLFLDPQRAPADVPRLLRSLFDEVALSPYTEFVPRTLAFLELLVERGGLAREEQIDFLSYLLRQLGRHLTAYDLVTFHHRGANYPDLLLLDAALRAYLGLIERHPDGFRAADTELEAPADRRRLRRRALRQAWLLRRRYEGHLVPDTPTSPGENARVLPPPYVRCPEEQIVDPGRRTRRLFANDPLSNSLGVTGREVLAQSVADLRAEAELRELGMALFLDRPLSGARAPGEPDQTLLLSYEAFSRSVARQRLRELAETCGLLTAPLEEAHAERLRTLRVDGVAPPRSAGRPRPGGVSLADAFRVAADFIVLRTTAKSVAEFLQLFDFTSLATRVSVDSLIGGGRMLILRDGEDRLLILDNQLQQRLALQVNSADGYETRGGVEYPRAGLKVLRVGAVDLAETVIVPVC